jgi:hypothetical protein
MKLKLLTVLISVLSITTLSAQSFKGVLLDSQEKTPLPFAHVYFVDLKIGTTSDEKGEFTIEHFKQKSIHLQIHFIAYKTIDVIVKLDSLKEKKILA